MIEFVSHSNLDTEKFAKKFASKLKPGQTVLFFGDMGSGKTTFSKSVAKFLGFDGVVTSPTFALANVYEGKCLIQHFDMYRLESESEAIEVGIDEMLQNKQAINLVEWPQKAKNILPKDCIKVFVTILSDTTRKFQVEGIDELS